MNKQKFVRQQMESIIEDMNQNKVVFVNRPFKDFSRKQKMGFEDTLKMLLTMRGNTMQKELYDFFKKKPKYVASYSCFYKRRKQLAEDTLPYMFYSFNDATQCLDKKKMDGYRLYAVDGSDINLAFNAESETYINYNPKSDKGSNQYHLNVVYDILNKTYKDIVLQPRKRVNERKALKKMLTKRHINEKSLYICDRGYFSYDLLSLFNRTENADWLIRVPKTLKLFSSLPYDEVDLERYVYLKEETKAVVGLGEVYTGIVGIKPSGAKSYISVGVSSVCENIPIECIKVRILRLKLESGEYEYLVTTLPKDKFSTDEVRELYKQRWEVETSFRDLKYSVGLVNIHSRREDFAVQEIYARLIMYNFAQRIIQDQVKSLKTITDPSYRRKYQYTISFKMGLTVCIDYLRHLIDDDELVSLFSRYIVAIRPGRRRKRGPISSKGFNSFVYRIV